MGFFKKEVRPLLTEEDQKSLREIERKAYLEEAEKLVAARGRQRAKAELDTNKGQFV